MSVIFNIGDKVTWASKSAYMMGRRYGAGPFIVTKLDSVPYQREDSCCKHCCTPMRANGSKTNDEIMFESTNDNALGCRHEEDDFSTYGGYNHPHWVDLERPDEKDVRDNPGTVIGVHLRLWTEEDQEIYDSLNTFPVHVKGIRRW